jgi:hypothetical protein
VSDGGILHLIFIIINRRHPGLNLTACNNVILVDLWWNPALEVRPVCVYVNVILN